MSTPTNSSANKRLSQDTNISVTLVYARTQGVWNQTLNLVAGSTIHDTLRLSSFFELFPDFTDETIQVGIYGRQCALDQLLNDHDRVEIYRNLIFDPMESRRRRQRHRQRQKK